MEIISLLVYLIIAVLIIGFLFYLLRWAMQVMEVPAKLQAIVQIVILLIVFLALISWLFGGGGGLHIPRMR